MTKHFLYIIEMTKNLDNEITIAFNLIFNVFLYILTQSRKSGMIVYGGTFKTFRNNS